MHKSLIIGGAESILINYLKLLSKHHQYQVRLVLQQNLPQNIHIEQIPDNIQIDFLLSPNESLQLADCDTKLDSDEFKQLRQLLQERMYHYLSHNPPMCIVNFNTHFDFFLEKYTLSIPIIRWVHGLSHLELWYGSTQYYQAILPKHALLIAINQEMQRIMQWVLTQLDIKIKNGYLYNPIDIEHIQQKSNQQPNNPTDLALLHQPFLLQVARLESGKNHQQLINIFAQLKQQGLPHKLYIIGDGELYHTLNHQIQTLGLAKECLLLGSYTNPYPFMKHADLFLHTSLHEGLPTVLIESMICGTPVVAMKCRTGVAEILGDGQYGALIEAGNQQDFIDATSALLNNPSKIQQYQEKLPQAVQRFSFQNIETMTLNMFDYVFAKFGIKR